MYILAKLGHWQPRIFVDSNKTSPKCIATVLCGQLPCRGGGHLVATPPLLIAAHTRHLPCTHGLRQGLHLPLAHHHFGRLGEVLYKAWDIQKEAFYGRNIRHTCHQMLFK